MVETWVMLLGTTGIGVLPPDAVKPLLYNFSEHFAVATCAVTGVLAARGKRVDLFGVLVLALATALGGGTLRDVCLGIPVFWIRDAGYALTALAAALVTFVVVRFRPLPEAILLVADAFGLALFSIVGVEKALTYGAAPFVAVLLGVLTGVGGGMIRDLLTGEIPMVFQPDIYLYATASFCGAGVLLLLQHSFPARPGQSIVAMGVILVLRLAAIQWKLRLPMFRSHREADRPR